MHASVGHGVSWICVNLLRCISDRMAWLAKKNATGGLDGVAHGPEDFAAWAADVLATAFACQLPGGLRFCGSDVCGSSFAPDAARQKTPAAKPPPRGPRRLHYEKAAPPVRLATPPRASGGPPGPRD